MARMFQSGFFSAEVRCPEQPVRANHHRAEIGAAVASRAWLDDPRCRAVPTHRSRGSRSSRDWPRGSRTVRSSLCGSGEDVELRGQKKNMPDPRGSRGASVEGDLSLARNWTGARPRSRQ